MTRSVTRHVPHHPLPIAQPQSVSLSERSRNGERRHRVRHPKGLRLRQLKQRAIQGRHSNGDPGVNIVRHIKQVVEVSVGEKHHGQAHIMLPTVAEHLVRCSERCVDHPAFTSGRIRQQVGVGIDRGSGPAI